MVWFSWTLSSRFVHHFTSYIHTFIVFQEGLRLDPIIPTLVREADSDDVIPLAQPIETKSGKIIHEIPVSKGQGISASICTYNRLVSILSRVAPLLRLYRLDWKASGEKMRINGTPTASWTEIGNDPHWEFSPICVYFFSHGKCLWTNLSDTSGWLSVSCPISCSSDSHSYLFHKKPLVSVLALGELLFIDG